MEWFDAYLSKPEQLERSSYSRYVLVWIECDNGASYWAADRFDHVSKTWDVSHGERVTHWADPRKPSAP